MKKIPTLFKREYANHRVVGIENEITPGCEEAFASGIATIKIDGACCAVIGGEFYRRYDAKKGKKPPTGAIPCCDPDPITGHWPHWVKVDPNNPDDKWFVEANNNTCAYNFVFKLMDGTYEAVGPHFQANPYDLSLDFLLPHGKLCVDIDRTFEAVKNYLENNCVEGLVFWLNGEPVCKIKRSDFGLPWPIKKEEK